MIKKIFALMICVTVMSFFSIADAHGSFTWFGLRRDNTEVVFQTSGHHDDCGPKGHCKHKHKKPKPKHKHHKKGPKAHKWWHWD